MYDSRTIKPTLPGRHGHMRAHQYRGEGDWISDETPRHVQYRIAVTDKAAIAEGLADLEDVDTFTDVMDCESIEDMKVLAWVLDRDSDCGDSWCDICGNPDA